MEISISADNWAKYCCSVGDYNPIHRSNDAAKPFGLFGKIAPGMFIASHIQGDRNITGARIKFFKEVYDGDMLFITGNGAGYSFRRGEDIVCRVDRVSVGDFDSRVPKLFEDGDILHRYSVAIANENIINFQGSLGIRRGNPNLDGMYLASLSAPALLDFGKKTSFVGVHASQTFTAYSELKPGSIDILIGNKKVRGEGVIHSYDLQWVNKGVDGENSLIASGRAMVAPLRV